ncbi:glycoside hydrolase family 24 protein [Pseudomonas asiatica]|uniref:glycoside hydrolase family 24 protein n=1 Tax=Pseudomonas asiatica TaxID=2219225 RepID=UPI003457E6B0
MARLASAAVGGANVLAFLDMLAWSEGTSTIAASDDGYNVLVGGQLFNDYSGHPKQKVWLPSYGIHSSAAGRYQILAGTWDAIVSTYGFNGRFTPEAQDLAAIKLLSERGALALIKAGRIVQAIAKAAPIWVSLPGAGYGQREHQLAALLAMFIACGGEVQA